MHRSCGREDALRPISPFTADMHRKFVYFLPVQLVEPGGGLLGLGNKFFFQSESASKNHLQDWACLLRIFLVLRHVWAVHVTPPEAKRHCRKLSDRAKGQRHRRFTPCSVSEWSKFQTSLSFQSHSAIRTQAFLARFPASTTKYVYS